MSDTPEPSKTPSSSGPAGPGTAVAQIPRSSRPVSEALLNEKWDRAISSMLIRSTLGLSFGVVFSVLLFKRRAWPAWLGLGFGAGRAWEEADHSFRRGDAPWRRDARSS